MFCNSGLVYHFKFCELAPMSFDNGLSDLLLTSRFLNTVSCWHAVVVLVHKYSGYDNALLGGERYFYKHFNIMCMYLVWNMHLKAYFGSAN